MASGQPFSEREKAFIRQHAGIMVNGMIAQELARRYPEDNNGYRSYRSVRSFIYRESLSADIVLTVRVPAKLITAARQAGVTMDEIGSIARTAILAKIRA